MRENEGGGSGGGEEKAGQVAEASLIATQKKGQGLFQRTVMLVCSLKRMSVPVPPLPPVHPATHPTPPPNAPPRPPSRQVQNRLYLLWEEEEKMCSVIRLPAASQENWVVAVAGLQGVCGSLCDLCLLWTFSIGVRWLTAAATPALQKVIDLIKAFSCWILFPLNRLGDQRQTGNANHKCEAET